MQQGTVKFFNASKGFGFITPDDGEKDVFVPAVSVTSSGVTALKTGQRISFESVPDGKGPKAVNLILLADVRPQPKVVAETVAKRPKEEEPRRLTIYHDPDCAKSRKALADLRAAGHEPRVVEYLSTAVTKDELKALSTLVGHSGQSLVRKYDPLFLALQLDDKFISESEFWDAIVEHPGLINGPVVATADRACVCMSDGSVKMFLAASSSNAAVAAPKPKGLPPRLLKMLRGETATPPAANDHMPEVVEDRIPPSTRQKAEVAPRPKNKGKAEAKPKSKTATKVKAPPKPKKAARKTAIKTTKKTKRKSSR